MPQYELMYIISSDVADADENAIADSVVSTVVELGGEILNVEKLGKKRLAYPIKRHKIGSYQIVNFRLSSDKIGELEHKIRVTGEIIRHLVLNKEESLIRQAKDREEQKLIRRRIPVGEDGESKTPSGKPAMQIDLDKQIEKALESDDLTK